VYLPRTQPVPKEVTDYNRKKKLVIETKDTWEGKEEKQGMLKEEN